MSIESLFPCFFAAVAEIKSRFKCISWESAKDREPWIAPDGQRSVEFLIGAGEHSEREVFCLSERAATSIWLDMVMKAGEGKSTIYWRIEPEIQIVYKYLYTENAYINGLPYPNYEERPIYKIYSRQVFA